MQYSKPTVTELGSVREITLAFNKIGKDSDVYSPTTPLIGSLVAP